MRAEQLPGLLVEDHLHQALIFSKGNRLTVTDERKAADADVKVLVFGRLLGQSNRRDLRRTISAAGNHQFVHGVGMQAFDRLDAHDALMLGLVRQHRRTGYVTDRIDARHVGLVEWIDHDATTFGFHAELFQSEIFDIADHAHGRNHSLGGDGLGPAILFDRDGDAVDFFIELGHLCAGQNLDALLLEALASESLDFVILDWENLRQHLDHRHFGPKRAVERRELDADRARANHQQRLRNGRRHHGLEISPDQFLVGLEAGQHARPGPRGDDNVFGLV